MSMFDFDAVLMKNGAILNENKYCDMEKALGFTVAFGIKKDNNTSSRVKIKGHYCAYAGNRDLFYGFDRGCITVFKRIGHQYIVKKELSERDFINKRYADKNKCGVSVSVSVTGFGRYIAKVYTPEKTNYKVFFGYGVDSCYDTQLEIAFDYGFSTKEIEKISKKIWNRPVKVKGRNRNKYEYEKI